MTTCESTPHRELVVIATGSESDTWTVYACSEECVRLAAKRAHEEAMDEGARRERAAIAAIHARRRELGIPASVAVGVIGDRIWVSTSRDREGRYTGATLVEAIRAWMADHPELA